MLVLGESIEKLSDKLAGQHATSSSSPSALWPCCCGIWLNHIIKPIVNMESIVCSMDDSMDSSS